MVTCSCLRGRRWINALPTLPLVLLPLESHSKDLPIRWQLLALAGLSVVVLTEADCWEGTAHAAPLLPITSAAPEVVRQWRR